MRKLKEVNGKPQRRLFETSYLNTTPISSYYCVQFIPEVYFLLSTFLKQNINIELCGNEEAGLFLRSERKEDFIKSCLFTRLLYVLYHHI